MMIERTRRASYKRPPLLSLAPAHTTFNFLSFPFPMIIVIKPHTPREQVDEVMAEVQKLGYDPRPIFGTELTVIAGIGDERTHHTLESLISMPQVEKVMPVQKRHQLVSRETHPADTVVNVDGVKVGGANPFCLMAG